MTPYNVIFRSGLKRALDDPGGGGTRMENLSVLTNQGANGALSRGTSRGAMVYLLDDDDSVLKATGRLLRAAGWQVCPFTDPIQFLDRVEADQPACAVIDVRMPRMDGLQVQSRLREVAPLTRVILLTSDDDPEVRRRAVANGAQGFFYKPVLHEEFLETVAIACNGKS